MSVMIVHCHPYERSFCAAIAGAVRESCLATGIDHVFHDLYTEDPDPVLSGAEIARRYSLDGQIQGYSNELLESDQLVIVHPDWWNSPPAILKGWIERVFRPGVAYDWEGEEFQEKHHVPLLTGKRLRVYATTDRSMDDGNSALTLFWHELAAYSGLQLEELRIFYEMRSSGHRDRRAWLAEVAASIAEGGSGD